MNAAFTQLQQHGSGSHAVNAPARMVTPGRKGFLRPAALRSAGKPGRQCVMTAGNRRAILTAAGALLKRGALVPMVAGQDIGVWVKELEPGRRMLWWDQKGEYSWEWLLEPAAAGTRLISRLRATRHPWTRRMPYELVAANGDIIMTRKMMRGIKERAERPADLHPVPAGGNPVS
jgi:hypothetical protein